MVYISFLELLNFTTYCHKLDGLQQIYSLAVLETDEAEIKVLAGLFSLLLLEKTPSLPLCTFWWL